MCIRDRNYGRTDNAVSRNQLRCSPRHNFATRADGYFKLSPSSLTLLGFGRLSHYFHDLTEITYCSRWKTLQVQLIWASNNKSLLIRYFLLYSILIWTQQNCFMPLVIKIFLIRSIND